MPLEREDVERALESKLGFRRLDLHHRVFVLVGHLPNKLAVESADACCRLGQPMPINIANDPLEVAGRVLKTKTSHGTKHKTLGDELVSEMARQLFVPRTLFVELVRCTKTKTDYLQLLAERGMIPPETLRKGT